MANLLCFRELFLVFFLTCIVFPTNLVVLAVLAVLVVLAILAVPVWLVVLVYWVFLSLFPKTAGEENHDGENFETTDEHEEGADGFGEGAENCPGVGGTIVAHAWTDIADT